jgi:hypothetical protein
MILNDVIQRYEFKRIAEAFNEWLREYIEDPESFKATMTSVNELIDEELAGEEPSYGRDCALTLLEYLEKTQPVYDAFLGIRIMAESVGY